MNKLEKKIISESVTKGILEIVDEMSKVELPEERTRRNVRIENLMVRAYVGDPSMNYGICLKYVQSHMPGDPIELREIVRRAEMNRLHKGMVREDLAKWAFSVVEYVYAGMAGDEKAIKKALEMLAEKRSDRRIRRNMPERFVLTTMFECIPELCVSTGHDSILKLGGTFFRACLKNILSSITFDIAGSKIDPAIEKMTDISSLRRAVYLAREELDDYRKMVESADAEFEDKLQELKQQEIAAFFSALNNEKYGYLVDTLYLQKRVCAELKKKGESFPYAASGIPVFLDRLISFLRDVGVSPVSRFAPHSIQKLTLAQMEGYSFEPSPERKTPIKDDELVTVKVISSGWKLGDVIFSYPVLQEEDNN